MRSFQMDDLDTDTSYLEQDDAFVVNSLVEEWPTTSNPFVQRMVSKLSSGSSFSRMSLQEVMDLIGTAAVARPRETITYDLDLQVDADLLINLTVVGISNTNPPISADNAGFCAYAISWFSRQRPLFRLSVRADGLFWVHLPAA